MTVTTYVMNPGQQLTAVAAAIFTCPTNQKAIIRRAVFTNTDVGAAYTVTIYRVPLGGTAGTTNIIVNAASIAAGLAAIPPELANMVLTGGESIWALASTTLKINAFMSGFLTTQ